MKRIILSILSAIIVAAGMSAAERSYKIVFGADAESTNTLTNSDFISKGVRSGASYIEGVTSVVSVFTCTDGIRLGSAKRDGKFNIALTEDASIVASRIVVSAKKFRESDAEVYVHLNGEPLEVPGIEYEDITLSIPSRPEKTLTNLIVDGENRLYLESITVYYDDAQGTVDPEMQTVATPVISPAGGTITADTAVEISCATPGAKIYYSIDGTVPSTASNLYEGPIVVNNSLTVRAFATLDGMTPSEMAEAEFSVRNPGATYESTFDFSNPESLTPSVEAPAQKESVDLNGRQFSDGDVVISFIASESGNTHTRLYHSYDAGIDLRLYSGDVLVIRTLNPSLFIREVSFTQSLSGAATGSADIDFFASDGLWTWEDEKWTPGENGPMLQLLELTSINQSRIASMTVTLDRSSGLSEIRPDHDHEAVFYTIMGRRISAQTLAPGLYIKVQGGRAEKVYIR